MRPTKLITSILNTIVYHLARVGSSSDELIKQLICHPIVKTIQIKMLYPIPKCFCSSYGNSLPENSGCILSSYVLHYSMFQSRQLV